MSTFLILIVDFNFHFLLSNDLLFLKRIIGNNLRYYENSTKEIYGKTRLGSLWQR